MRDWLKLGGMLQIDGKENLQKDAGFLSRIKIQKNNLLLINATQ